jgi:transcriptional regulator with XRE-family HTH domain
MTQTFGALLRQVRGAGRSQSDIAAIIARKTRYRPSQQNIGRWERGEGVDGGIRQELEMLDALGVPPKVAIQSLIGDLLDEDESVVPVPVAINLDRRLSDDERRVLVELHRMFAWPRDRRREDRPSANGKEKRRATASGPNDKKAPT